MKKKCIKHTGDEYTGDIWLSERDRKQHEKWMKEHNPHIPLA